jgi:putative methionine-R-sulfoxide reductase with GAF domain
MTDNELMRRQLESLSEGVDWDVTIMANAAALLWEALDDINCYIELKTLVLQNTYVLKT